MKHLFVQISDLHIKENDKISSNTVDKIIRGLFEYENFDELYLMFSGDIVYSGKKQEYSKAISFLKQLIRSIKKILKYQKHIRFYFVPGNHDNEYMEYNKKRIQIEKIFEDGISEEKIKIERLKQKNFFDFTDYHSNFKSDCLIDIKKIRTNNELTQINLINSSLFSTVDNHKGILYLPLNRLNKVKKKEKTISVSMMHHPPSWFNSNQANDIEKIIYSNTDILLVGHEHKARNKDVKYNSDRNIIILDGGVINLSGLEVGNSYNSFMYDSEIDSLSYGTHEWNVEKEIFVYKNNSTKWKLLEGNFLNDKFIDEFVKDNKLLAKSFEDYFVFPKLSGALYDQEFSEFISSMNEFIEVMQDNEIIFIRGTSEMGKTIFLKKLFMEIYDKYKYVIMIDAEKDSLNNIERLIKYKIEEQYVSESLNFDDFKQRAVSKVLLLDNFNVIKGQAKEKIIDIFSKYFEFIVFTSSEDRKKVDINDFMSSYEAYDFKILPFVGEKRKELIKRVLELDSIKKEEDVQSLIKHMNNLFSKNLRMFDYRTGFIVEYIQYYSTNSTFTSEKIKKFDEVFQANVIKKINEVSEKTENYTNEILEVLTALAIGVHNEKQYPFDEKLMISIIGEVIEKYDYRIKVIDMINLLKKAKIIIEVDEKFKFMSQSYLAFFVARSIFQSFENYNSYDEIREILSTLCFGINGDVLLFLVMFSKSPRLLFKLLDEANEFMNQWGAFSFAEYNKTLFMKLNQEFLVSVASVEEKKKLNKENDINELNRVNELEVKVEQLYDYEIKDVILMSNQLIIATKYLETIARGFANFVYQIDVEYKEKLMNYIFDAPNRILDVLLSNINENYSEITNDLIFFLETKRDLKKETATKMATRFLTDIVTAIVPALYNDISDIVIDRKSAIYFVEYYNREDIDYRIRKLLVYLSLNDVEKIIRVKNQLYSDKLSRIEKVIIQKIIRKFILTSGPIPMPVMQKLTAHVFNIEYTKELFLKNNQYKESIS